VKEDINCRVFYGVGYSKSYSSDRRQCSRDKDPDVKAFRFNDIQHVNLVSLSALRSDHF
jgi:hypothetical protein